MQKVEKLDAKGFWACDVLPGMNSRASLASGDSPKAQRLTSETQNVPCRIDITVMDRSAWAGPLSYTKATQSTRTCLLQTDRASDRGISLIDFEHSSSPPEGLV